MSALQAKRNCHRSGEMGFSYIRNKSLGLDISFIVFRHQQHHAIVYLMDSDGKNKQRMYELNSQLRTQHLHEFNLLDSSFRDWLKIGNNEEMIFNDGSTYIAKYRDEFKFKEDDYDYYHCEGLDETFECQDHKWGNKGEVVYRAHRLILHFIKQIKEHINQEKVSFANAMIEYITNSPWPRRDVKYEICLDIKYLYHKTNEPTEKCLDTVLTQCMKISPKKTQERNNDLQSKNLLGMDIWICVQGYILFHIQTYIYIYSNSLFVQKM